MTDTKTCYKLTFTYYVPSIPQWHNVTVRGFFINDVTKIGDGRGRHFLELK